MKANRVTAHVLTPPRTTARTQWSVLDPGTQQCRLVSADECFPIAGRLLSGVWQLDDGRVLMATSTDDGDDATHGPEQPTLRIEYIDRENAMVVRPQPPLRLADSGSK